MPRVVINSEKYRINDFYDDLKWECKRTGLTQEQQAEICGCTAQNICKAYKSHSLSLTQYLKIRYALDDINEKQKASRPILTDGKAVEYR